MVRPRLTDDGRTVVLDLHGASVDDAVDMIRRVARLASSRGRATLRVVHGSSTSDPRSRNRTIRHALYDLIETGDLSPWMTDAVRADGHTLIGLAAHGPYVSERLGPADLRDTSTTR